MPKGVERIGAISSGGPKVRLECGNCGVCLLAEGGCPRGLTKIEFKGSLNSIKIVTGVGEIIENISKGFSKRTYVFRPVDEGKPASSEKRCSKCDNNYTICPHSHSLN